ncbi:hypothetical protein AB0K04_05860 [Micromonospora coxensis]|uniref:hypothetical protein n=1 Tax=Micromonospora coxensis TaxID=356852 RepID=UPI0034215804
MTPTRLTPPTPAGHRSAVLARRVVGTPAEVAATIALVHNSGRLLSSTPPRDVPGTGQVTVTVRFLDTSTAVPLPVRRSRRGRLIVAVAIVVVGALFALGCLAARLVVTDALHSGPPLVAGFVLVLLALLLTPGKAASVRSRCSTCNH